jgi:FO synthase
MKLLREVSASQGMMMESLSSDIQGLGGVHFGSPDKTPSARLQALYTAGELRIPFTTGVLVGIGDTRHDRLHTLLQIRNAHETYGHVQEVIIQGFRSKINTKNSSYKDPDITELLWTISAARIILPSEIHIQTPPNLFPRDCISLLNAGIDDWGGVSPVTDDHVNPEAIWPTVEFLSDIAKFCGKTLLPRLPTYPRWIGNLWITDRVLSSVLRLSDSSGLARTNPWTPGTLSSPPRTTKVVGPIHRSFAKTIQKAISGQRLHVQDIVRLFSGNEYNHSVVVSAANTLRSSACGDTVRFVTNRNINYTNICYYRCSFCAFSKRTSPTKISDLPYNIDNSVIIRRAIEAWNKGATEVCLQGGIHPEYDGATYANICRDIKKILPAMHVHAFSPLEINQGATTYQTSNYSFLKELRLVGLGTLPGTAAEILDDSIRMIICPDKINTTEWIDIVRVAHRIGFRTTSTIMFGHVDRPANWARHILALRDLQEETGGFTEFVPLAFIHDEAPMYRQGKSRKGPTFSESVLMHAVSRLALNPIITNIQSSWVKMGLEGVVSCLDSGANDLGGTLMNESISRAAGTKNGQELSPENMRKLILNAEKIPVNRITEYYFSSIGKYNINHDSE